MGIGLHTTDHCSVNNLSAISSWHKIRFEEEEEDSGGISDYDIKSWNEGSLISSIRNFIKSTRSKDYKFIVIVLETSQTSLETKLHEHITDNPRFYDIESGSDILIIHNCNRIGANRSVEDLTSNMLAWLKHIKFERSSLPSLVVIPHTKYNLPSDDKSKMLIFSLGETRKLWNGTDEDYFVTVFRSLYDSVDNTPSRCWNPIETLQNEFKKRIRKVTSATLADKLTKLINMPVVGQIIRLFGAFV
jgi:hypothetical protein